MNYSGKREVVCRQCGKELPKFKSRFCSTECKTLYNRIKSGAITHPEILTKQCPVCGKEFKTWKSKKKTCSEECSRIQANRRKKTAEQYERARIKYHQLHPNAKTQEQISAEKKARETARAIQSEQRRIEQEKARAEKERIKQENIKHWLEYEADHECSVCGKTYTAHYPLSKYCSKTCQRKATRIKKRYEGITVDKDINLKKLAKRDHNQCQICGLSVDWTDFERIDGYTKCGWMYPSIDHKIPISLGGLHSWDNVKLAHRICNSRKSNKYIG